MVRDRVTDGTRIAKLLASEVHGRASGPLGRLAVVDADRDVDPTEFGAFAYGVALAGRPDRDDGPGEAGGDDADRTDRRLADAYVHPGRVHLEFREAVDAAVDAGTSAGLRTRPKAVEPPRALVFVESGAEVKRATDVLAAAVDSLAPASGDET